MATTEASRKSTTVTLRVPNAIVSQIRTIAEREHETYSIVIRRLLRQALEGERRTQDVAR